MPFQFAFEIAENHVYNCTSKNSIYSVQIKNKKKMKIEMP